MTMSNDQPQPVLSPRKAAIRQLADKLGSLRSALIGRNLYYYTEDYNYMRFLVPEGLQVLDLGCGSGELLAALKPSRGVGVDFSERMVEVARDKHPEYEFY